MILDHRTRTKINRPLWAALQLSQFFKCRAEYGYILMAVILMDDFWESTLCPVSSLLFDENRPKACCFFFDWSPPSRIVFEDPAFRGLGLSKWLNKCTRIGWVVWWLSPRSLGAFSNLCLIFFRIRLWFPKPSCWCWGWVVSGMHPKVYALVVGFRVAFSDCSPLAKVLHHHERGFAKKNEL